MHLTPSKDPLQGLLFLLRHLLILRDQITPFDVNFSATHDQLDFSHIRTLSLSALMSLSPMAWVQRLSPTIVQEHSNAKQVKLLRKIQLI